MKSGPTTDKHRNNHVLTLNRPQTQ